jgi:hypothetical protein
MVRITGRRVVLGLLIVVVAIQLIPVRRDNPSSVLQLLFA